MQTTSSRGRKSSAHGTVGDDLWAESPLMLVGKLAKDFEILKQLICLLSLI